ncbi:hypothetical protein FRC14_000136 [Serendipita sp. 396]|nr:hypothetical protein FRC14_000136 [Serendipita sp. 396]KAG8789120.1 hypothetical protein FRC15_011688 [Serendipita sp. 397]KAG8804188.1 hypothetical protein FRC16_000128 [Serendipita sp. 398]KAG8827178.1 hypothetical protein FRC19_004996 [Serendipita sp. 401]KAG8834720.1 hypothetical protein FRC18_001585 [Serendipita sp. 400]KAG8877287.1 hypothetical protein FRC20_011653 [Serendipita sp. 405]KAG9057553.1 hypothetical protein FS842_005765 [Serendipita sp. 407]
MSEEKLHSGSGIGSVNPTPMGETPTGSNQKLSGDNAEAKDSTPAEKGRFSRKKLLIAIACISVVIIVLVVILPVYFLVIKKKSNNGSSSSGGGHTSTDTGDTLPVPQPDGATSGGDGSTVYVEGGSSFVYSNKFGGYWSYDPARPFANEARAQSWTPALNETWKWGQDTIKGVNLGGWLVTEPFIVPALYQKYSGVTFDNGSYQVIDEWKLSEHMRADGSIGDLEKHYATFYTEEDFAQIAGAGLNWVRLPMPFWAIETVGNEPYIESVQWKYVLKAIGWARKYGLRINLDFHTHPGSQNGWNHSGLNSGPLGVNWLNGVMGVANAQRSLDYIRIITEFISQPEYAPVVPYFGIVNEPRIMAGNHVLYPETVQAFYLEAYKQIRSITGIGEGKGPMISIHDGFLAFTEWNTFLTGADRLSLDTHPYFAFDGPNDAALETFIPRPCSRWAGAINTTQSTFGVITAGEWSVAVNDCGLFVTGVNAEIRYTGAGGCDPWNNWENWDQATKDGLKQFALSTMDALQNWFFWTWKIGPSATDNAVRAPFWSYKLGLENGWLPKDPREAAGTCIKLGEAPNVFPGTFQPWQTGGTGAGEIQPAATATLTWPPTSLNPNYPVAQYLPTYTPTGTHTTLAVPSITAAGVSPGDGWFNDQDQAALMVPISGCEYPEAYGGALLPQPSVPWCSNTEIVPFPTPVAILTMDGDGLPLTTTVLEFSAIDGQVTIPIEDPAVTGTSTTTTAPVARRYAPRAGMPMPTL